MVIRPLTMMFVSTTRRGLLSNARLLSYRFDRLSDVLFKLFRVYTPICFTNFGYGLPGIDVPQSTPNHQRLRDNPANGSAFLKSLLSDILMSLR